MAERSVSQAAVAAGARAVCDDPPRCAAHAVCESVARAVISAVVREAEVREGLVAALADHACPRSEECIDGRVARAKVGTMLAALGGTEASRG